MAPHVACDVCVGERERERKRERERERERAWHALQHAVDPGGR